VYDPGRPDNEARSAEWAWRSILAAGCGEEVAQRVQALVLATKGHAPSEDPDTRLLLDIDLAILGAAPARFDDYDPADPRRVRAHAGGGVPRRPRRVLAAFLAPPRIYLTPPSTTRWSTRAREPRTRARRPAGLIRRRRRVVQRHARELLRNTPHRRDFRLTGLQRLAN
jgi:predicted metal-dependent HD superfamily phosphohydrolase